VRPKGRRSLWRCGGRTLTFRRNAQKFVFPIFQQFGRRLADRAERRAFAIAAGMLRKPLM
jgi:hypothetical protein